MPPRSETGRPFPLPAHYWHFEPSAEGSKCEQRAGGGRRRLAQGADEDLVLLGVPDAGLGHPLLGLRPVGREPLVSRVGAVLDQPVHPVVVQAYRVHQALRVQLDPVRVDEGSHPFEFPAPPSVVNVAARPQGGPQPDGVGHVPDHRPGRGPVEVDQRDGPPLPEDHVVQVEVVVTGQALVVLPWRHIRPVVPGHVEAGDRLVVAAQQVSHAAQRVVGQRPGRVGRHHRVARNEGQYLPALLVDAEQPRRPVEADLGQVGEQRVDGGAGRAQRTADRVATPDDKTTVVRSPDQRDLGEPVGHQRELGPSASASSSSAMDTWVTRVSTIPLSRAAQTAAALATPYGMAIRWSKLPIWAPAVAGSGTRNGAKNRYAGPPEIRANSRTMSTALSPWIELDVSFVLLLNAPVSWTTGTAGSRFSSLTIACTEPAQASPITSFGAMISLSRSAAAVPRLRRSEAGSSSGVSTTIACRNS